jgi:hypothetical protein
MFLCLCLERENEDGEIDAISMLKTRCVAVVQNRNEREVCRLRAAKSPRILQTMFLHW